MNCRLRVLLSMCLLCVSVSKALRADPPAAAADRAVVAGVSWHSDLKAASEQARREDKPILLLQMFGRLDDELC